jgi:hypothetical protein
LARGAGSTRGGPQRSVHSSWCATGCARISYPQVPRREPA